MRARTGRSSFRKARIPAGAGRAPTWQAVASGLKWTNVFKSFYWLEGIDAAMGDKPKGAD